MTDFQIFSPNGTKVCIIKAEVKVTTPNNGTFFYNFIPDLKYNNFKNFETPVDSCADIPPGWAAIPIEAIVKEENNFDYTISYLKNGAMYTKLRMQELAKSEDILDADRLQRMHGELDEVMKAVDVLKGV